MGLNRKMTKTDYHIVTFLDANSALKIVKKEYSNINDKIKENDRMEKELKKLMNALKKNTKYNIHHIGKDQSGTIPTFRFYIQEGGYLEITTGKPLTIIGHFINKEYANRFMKGLKKTLGEVIPDTMLKSMVIDSVSLEKGESQNEITKNKWKNLHSFLYHKTMILSILVIVIFTIIEATQEFFEAIASNYLHLQSVSISIFTALVIGIIFEPLKNFISKSFEKSYG